MSNQIIKYQSTAETIEQAPSPLPTIIIGCIFAVVIAAYFGGFFGDTSKPTKPAIMPTSPLASLATPTARPTRTATSAPTSTSTPQPTNTAFPTIAPSATPDLEFIAKQKLIENGANNQWWQITTDGIGSLLWKVGIFLGFLVVCFCASWLAFVTGWRALKDYQNAPKVEKAVQNDPQPNTQATQASNQLLHAGFTIEHIKGFVVILEGKLGGIYTSSDESLFYPDPFETQDLHRRFVRKMKALQYLVPVGGNGFGLSEDGWLMVDGLVNGKE